MPCSMAGRRMERSSAPPAAAALAVALIGSLALTRSASPAAADAASAAFARPHRRSNPGPRLARPAPSLPPAGAAWVVGPASSLAQPLGPLGSSSSDGTNDEGGGANGSGPFSSLTLGGGGGGGPSLLNEAFRNLDVGDQYDAVLTGLCAKILDGDVDGAAAGAELSSEEEASMSATDVAYTRLSDPMALLSEMTSRRVRAGPRSLSSLIDAAVSTEDVRVTASVMRLATANGGVGNFGSLQGTVTSLPSNPRTAVLCPDGVRRTRDERLTLLPSVPTDDRSAEVASALSTAAVLSFCLVFRSLGSLFGYDTAAGYADLVFGTIVTVGIIDNFYDAFRAAGTFLANTQRDKIPDAVKGKVPGLPDKESMPLGLGTGKLTGTVVRGFTRLLSVDTERECECEAAAFFAAYALGLPCFGFRPNALEAAVLVFESTKDDDRGDDLDPLLSDVGILKVLIWLMAPVAMESGRHVQLIASDPREGPGLLRRLREKASTVAGGTAASDLDDVLGGAAGSGDGKNVEEECEDLLKWAYAEADLLLRDNKRVVDELTERLAGGAATVGDCVTVLEGW